MFTVSVAVLALSPAFVCNAPAAIVFVAAPAVLLVTVKITVQPPAGIDVPFATVKSFAVALTPVHVPPGVPGFVIVTPAGIVSVNALVKVIATRFVFPIVTVRFVFPPLARFTAAKSFATVGATRAVTVSVAFAAVPVNATGPVAAGAVVVLLFVLVAVTLCVIVHVSPGSSVPALKPTEVPPFAPPVRVALLPASQLTLPAALFSSVPV